MPSFNLREPLQAVQYQHPTNARDVYVLLNARGGASFATDRGHLRCWNLPDGGAIEVADGNWVVAVDDEFVVLGDAQFQRLFVLDDEPA